MTGPRWKNREKLCLHHPAIGTKSTQKLGLVTEIHLRPQQTTDRRRAFKYILRPLPHNQPHSNKLKLGSNLKGQDVALKSKELTSSTCYTHSTILHWNRSHGTVGNKEDRVVIWGSIASCLSNRVTSRHHLGGPLQPEQWVSYLTPVAIATESPVGTI